MNTAAMNAEAARCFRRACEANDPLDQTIFISLRQAWLALALQVEQSAMERPGQVLPRAAPENPAAKRRRSRAGQKSAPRTRRRKLAA
jgi:hypothetical protein